MSLFYMFGVRLPAESLKQALPFFLLKTFLLLTLWEVMVKNKAKRTQLVRGK